MSLDPSFQVVMSRACRRFFVYHLRKIVNNGPDNWQAVGRLEFARIEDALLSVEHPQNEYRPVLSRREASTLIALAQRNMAGGEYDFRDLTYRNEEEDWDRQLAEYEEILIESNQYPSSLSALIVRLEVMTGMRKGVAAPVTDRGLHSGHVQQQRR